MGSKVMSSKDVVLILTEEDVVKLTALLGCLRCGILEGLFDSLADVIEDRGLRHWRELYLVKATSNELVGGAIDLVTKDQVSDLPSLREPDEVDDSEYRCWNCGYVGTVEDWHDSRCTPHACGFCPECEFPSR